tara:strand:+ start:357 stop:527 length:171 start_codon:yes stop_codon:yes gene_type:complete
MKRPLKVFYLPDLEGNWHWLMCDRDDNLIAESRQSHFHLIDAQNEAESLMVFAIAI